MDGSPFFTCVARGGDARMRFDDFPDRVERLLARLGDLTGLSVLEPGCGAGPLTQRLAHGVGPHGRLFAFDHSIGMVEACRRHVGSLPQAVIRQADLYHLALGPGVWDLVLLFRVFPHFDRKEEVLRRLHPTLKPGGRLVIANLEGSAQLNAMHASFSEAIQHDKMQCASSTRRKLEQES